MSATEIFETERPRLKRLAYRMLGEVSEAEDVVQDAWLRWREAKAVDLSLIHISEPTRPY